MAEDRAKFAEQLVGVVSHDLRNPLSVFHMSAILLERGVPPDQQQLVLGRIARAVGRMQHLISDLLDFSQARLGRGLAIHKRPCDLQHVIADGVAELAVAFRHDAALLLGQLIPRDVERNPEPAMASVGKILRLKDADTLRSAYDAYAKNLINRRMTVPAKMVAETLEIARADGAVLRRKPNEIFDNTFVDNLEKSGFMKELWGGAVPDDKKPPR